jgi:hypothetical protein
MTTQIKYHRWDYYFSYWLFTWALIYLVLFWMYNKHLTINSYMYFFIRFCNPIILIIIALVENIIGFIVICVKNVNYIIIILYFIVILFTKILPIWLLSYTSFIPSINNIIVIVLFIIIYWSYLIYNEINIVDLYYYSIENIIKGNTPFIRFILANTGVGL